MPTLLPLLLATSLRHAASFAGAYAEAMRADAMNQSVTRKNTNFSARALSSEYQNHRALDECTGKGHPAHTFGNCWESRCCTDHDDFCLLHRKSGHREADGYAQCKPKRDGCDDDDWICPDKPDSSHKSDSSDKSDSGDDDDDDSSGKPDKVVNLVELPDVSDKRKQSVLDACARSELASTCTLDFQARNGHLFASGAMFSIKGINWYGAEGGLGVPEGMREHPLGWYMDFLASNGFNAIRLLVNADNVLDNNEVNGEHIGLQANMAGNTYLEMLRTFSQEAAKRGILVMLACHRLRESAWPGKGLWYDDHTSESEMVKMWRTLAKSLCGQWNVFAADLFNEPHSASWGQGDSKTDWGLAAQRLGNEVLDVCPSWLIMIEGVGYKPGAQGSHGVEGVWWGENLFGTKTAPVKLSDQTKLVYSPHTYGPSVYMQSYFKDDKFPHNMPSVWDEHFAFVSRETKQPIVVGELGGFYGDKDKEWQDAAIEFFRDHSIGLFYFCLNPSSRDTGGILKKDWSTPDSDKIKLLSRLSTSDVVRHILANPKAAHLSDGEDRHH